MNILKNIFTGTIAVAFTTTACFAAASKCDDPLYRSAYPEKCKTSTNTTLLALAGGAALVGVGVALASQTSGSHGSSSQISNQDTFSRDALSSNIEINYAQTDTIKNTRLSSSYIESMTNGSDIDSATIKKIKDSAKIQKNYQQYDAINFAIANARGYTGKNTKINVLDDFYSDHGTNVHYVLHNIAPDAVITDYNAATSGGNFNSFDYIATKIKDSTPAHIYNASWQIESTDSLNAATVIYEKNSPKTYAKAQQYMYNLTSENFITQIRNTAFENDAIFVWAAGNEGKLGTEYHPESGALSAMPLAFPDLQGHFVNVVALDNYGKIAWYSNQCGITQNYCIAAPGSGWSTDTKEYTSGTSFAAPVVSGAIATIKEAFPYMTASQITALLFTTATDLGETGVDAVYGWGLLDMEKATKPVGTPKIVLSDNTIQPLGTSNISGAAGAAIKNANIKIAFVDDFGRAFTTNLSDNIHVVPYGRGFDKLRETEDDALILFNRIEFGSVQNHLLESSGLISMQSNQFTDFVGYKNEFTINNIKFYQNVRMGTFSPEAQDNSIISGFSNIYTASLKTGAQFGDFDIEFAIPEAIISGDMYLNIPVTRTNNGDIIYSNKRIDLTTAPSVEYTLKYKYLSATYVNNPSTQDEFFIMAKTKVTF